jgi:hypothetical protein
VASDNRQVYEEGLFIPPIKLYDAGVLNESVLNMIRWNVRTPEEVTGDIRSQVAANHVCSQKIIEMLEDEGLDTLDGLAMKLSIERKPVCGKPLAKSPMVSTLMKALLKGPVKEKMSISNLRWK